MDPNAARAPRRDHRQRSGGGTMSLPPGGGIGKARILPWLAIIIYKTAPEAASDSQLVRPDLSWRPSNFKLQSSRNELDPNQHADGGRAGIDSSTPTNHDDASSSPTALGALPAFVDRPTGIHSIPHTTPFSLNHHLTPPSNRATTSSQWPSPSSGARAPRRFSSSPPLPCSPRSPGRATPAANPSSPPWRRSPWMSSTRSSRSVSPLSCTPYPPANHPPPPLSRPAPSYPPSPPKKPPRTPPSRP